VRAFECERYDALVLRERVIEVDPAEAARLLIDAWKRRGPTPSDASFLRRMAFAGLDPGLEELLQAAVAGRDRLSDVDLAAAAPFALTRDLGRLAPERLSVPSGRSMAIEYREDGSAQVSVKLQELFGLAETPLLGPWRTPVTLELLAPNGRPVQTTRDLRSFWDRTYPEVRKELRGRYPRHPWPEDPWSAVPTHRAKPRGQPPS